jgi:hypothetical protein
MDKKDRAEGSGEERRNPRNNKGGEQHIRGST